MRVISYYTNEFYRDQALALASSAEAVGLSVTLYAEPHADAWWKNTNRKCEVVRKALLEAGDEPVLFQDADTRFLAYPELLYHVDADFALFFITPSKQGVPSGGTLWFNGRRALPLVEEWCRNVRARPHLDDDAFNLKGAIQTIRPSIYHLPPAYNWDEASMRTLYPGAVPVIQHYFVGEHDYPVDHFRGGQR